MDSLTLLRRPKAPESGPKEEQLTFSGLKPTTGKVPRQHDSHTEAIQHYSPEYDRPLHPLLTAYEHATSLIGPVNSPVVPPSLLNPSTAPAPWREARRPDDNLVNLIDLATVAPKELPLFTLNDFVEEALRSKTVETALEKPLKSRENFKSFHSTPLGVSGLERSSRAAKENDDKVLPVVRKKELIEDVDIKEAKAQRKPAYQNLIEMRAKIRDQVKIVETPMLMDTDVVDNVFPESNALFNLGTTGFFQGQARSGTPFVMPDDAQVSTATAAVLNCVRENSKSLNLRAHFIKIMPDITPLSLVLVELNLSFNNFKLIPTQVLYMPNLEWLSMRNNPIMQLPTDMLGVPKLQHLNLSFCLIHVIPDGFFSMPQLRELNLSYNHITSLPACISRLHDLKLLNVEGNQLSSLPFSILSLDLETVAVRNNFMSRVLWEEYSSKAPLSLKDMAAKVVIDKDLSFKRYLKNDLCDWLERSIAICECCGGNLIGNGLIITRSIAQNVLGVKNLPLRFRSCSITCFYEYKNMKNLDVIEGSQATIPPLTLNHTSDEGGDH